MRGKGFFNLILDLEFQDKMTKIRLQLKTCCVSLYLIIPYEKDISNLWIFFSTYLTKFGEREKLESYGSPWRINVL